MPKASVNGINLYYESQGSGPGIICCHGYAGSHQDWSYQIPALARRYRVVTFDHRGHGNSDAPAAAGDYSIPIFAADVYGLTANLGIKRACLVGHSMGGFVTLQLALEHPELVNAVVLIDTASEWVKMPGYRELRDRVAEIARNEGMAAAFEYDAAHSPIFRQRYEENPRLKELARQRICQTSVDGYIYANEAIRNWPGVTERLREIKAPTLVVVGEKDSFFIEPTRFLAESIPNARLKTVPQAGHCPHEERPTAFNRVLLDFLGEIGY